MSAESEMNSVDQVPEEQKNNVLNELKKDLEGWRETLLPLNRILNWDKPYHPAIIVAITTFHFLLIWYFEPSVLTTFSLLGLIISIIDFVVPILGPRLLSEKWTVVQEKQYEQICVRLHNAKTHLSNFVDALTTLKTEKPKVYFLVVMGTLAFFTYIGCVVDNLLLTFILVNICLLVPGMRRHQILRRYFQAAGVVLKRIILGKKPKEKAT